MGRRAVVVLAVEVKTSSIIVVEVGDSVVVAVVASSVVSVEICVEETVESVEDSAVVVESAVIVDSVIVVDPMVVVVKSAADVVTEASTEDVNSADVEITDVEIDKSDTAVVMTSVGVFTEISDDATKVVDPRSATEVDSEIAIVVVPVTSVCSLNAVVSDNTTEELMPEEKMDSEMARVVVVESHCSVAFVVYVDNVEDSPRVSVVVVVAIADLGY
jgi:hypothetical protein